MSKSAIGIDLGTSTSEVAVFQKGEPRAIPDALTKTPIIPSLVALNKRGELLVGEEARAIVDLPQQGIREVKRRMGSGEKVHLGGQEFRPEEISALLLRRLRQNAETYLGEEVTEVVLSVPANFPDAARKATLSAGEIAGLKILHLINEPTAAALAFGIQNLDKEEEMVIFDFGGGTLDVSVLEMMEGVLDVKASFGDPQLGGKDIDEALMKMILGRFESEVKAAEISERSRGMLKGHAERVKCELSSQRSVFLQVPMFAMSRGEAIDLEMEITRDDFQKAISPLLDRTRVCVKQALKAGKMKAEAVDRVLLIGGTTYIPAIREVVAEIFGKQPRTDVHPDLAVALGAATKAALSKKLISQESGLLLTDVAPYGLGISVVSEIGGRPFLRYEALIKPNQTIPFSVKRSYRLLWEEQDTVEMELYQDQTGGALLPEQAIFTGVSGEITEIPPSTSGQPHAVEVEFSYDADGIARLTATLPQTKQSICISHRASALVMDDEDKAKAAARQEELWRTSSKARRYEALIRRTETALVNFHQPAKLQAALSGLKEALAQNKESDIEAFAERITDLLFEADGELEA